MAETPVAAMLASSSGLDGVVADKSLVDSASSRLPDTGDMMARFEALSKLFKNEVECLFGQEKLTVQEDFGRLDAGRKALEAELAAERHEAAAAMQALRRFALERQADHFAEIFGEEIRDEAEQVETQRLRSTLEAFLQVNSSVVSPELAKSEATVRELRAQVAADASELAKLREELFEARVIKSQEERDLVEFRSLREKESELQHSRIETQQLQRCLEELQTRCENVDARNHQLQAVLKEKSDKIISLLRKTEQQGEQLRLLSDENNTFLLELGRDSDCTHSRDPIQETLSYTCESGKLSQELVEEEHCMRDHLESQVTKFLGVVGFGPSSGSWCKVHIDKLLYFHQSFLHRLQDYSATFPDGVALELVSQAYEVDLAWAQHEEALRDEDAAFQVAEKAYSSRWEEQRLKLTTERDAKVKQLLEQAERSKSTAEQQLLMHQAKLFGQRIDAQVERALEDQRKERELRWADHQQRKQEQSQKLRDISLSAQRQAEEKANGAVRFLDLARGKLASVEDAWLRDSEKASVVSTTALRSHFDILLRSSHPDTAFDIARLPAKGAQHTGICVVIDRLEELLEARTKARADLRSDLEQHSLQQLRSCVESFIQRESAQRGKHGTDESGSPEASQASAILSLLRLRQHRHLSDTLKRQFYDYLLVLRLCALASVWLLPSGMAASLNESARGLAALDLPPLHLELAAVGKIELNLAGIVAVSARDFDDIASDASVEATCLYNSLCHGLLERALKVMSTRQREELLGLKRAYVIEQRQVLEHLCQLESGEVSKIILLDLRDYELQMKGRLHGDTEQQLSEERKRISSRVAEEVSMLVSSYKYEAEQEELRIVRERRKWLMDRLVVLQTAGSQDRAILHRMRQELRACESKIELRDNQVVNASPPATVASVPKPPLTPRAPTEPPLSDSPARLRPESSSRRRKSSPSPALIAPLSVLGPDDVDTTQRPVTRGRGSKRPDWPVAETQHIPSPRSTILSSEQMWVQPGATGQELPQKTTSKRAKSKPLDIDDDELLVAVAAPLPHFGLGPPVDASASLQDQSTATARGCQGSVVSLGALTSRPPVVPGPRFASAGGPRMKPLDCLVTPRGVGKDPTRPSSPMMEEVPFSSRGARSAGISLMLPPVFK